MKKLEGKVAIVTGGGQGCGLGIARALAANGAHIVLTGRHEDKLKAVAPSIEKHGVQVLIVPGNVRDRKHAGETVAATIAKFGRLDILVNNAVSMIPVMPIEQIDDEGMDSVIESGLYGTIYFSQAAFAPLKVKGGSIINLGSREGILGSKGMSIYAATKEAIRGFSRASAREWGAYGIRVNVLNPAALSPGVEQWIKENPETMKQIAAQIAMGRLGDAETDIGPIAVFLASDESAYMTGQTLNVDGGQAML